MNIIEKTASHGFLGEHEIASVISESMSQLDPDGRRVLVIVPDTTRTAPVPLLFRCLCDLLLHRAEKLDFLVALGTHPPLSEEAMLTHFGLSAGEKAERYGAVELMNHRWDLNGDLTTLGEIPAHEVSALSDGLLNESIPVQLNRRILNYDLILIAGPVFPHEVVGFSGGNKYFFPGIAGPDIVHATHWLGALLTNTRINGTKKTPIRDVMDRAASFIPVEKKCLALVTTHSGVKGIFFGSPEAAWSKAADLSAVTHIQYTDRLYHTVLGVAPQMYDDLWVAGKVMYKLEPVVSDNGRLIIYAPHISEVSYTHGRLIDETGYHVRDYFLKQPDRFKGTPRAVMAHSTHVRGTGVFENGVEKPRIEVILATRIPEIRCRKINLGYMNYRDVILSEYQNRENEGILFVENAGETLYRHQHSPGKGQKG